MKLPSEQECIKCEESTYVERDDDVYCPNCYYVKRSQTGKMSRPNEWERFWKQRQQYSGHHGESRKRCVGGFIGAWDDFDF